MWAEKVVEPLTAGEATASHLTTLTAAVARLADEQKTTDTDVRRRRLACWLWCATLSGYPTQLKHPERLARDVRDLTQWLRGDADLRDPVRAARDAPTTAEQLLRERSRKGRLFRCVQVQLYQRNVRDLQTGEPIEVGLHFGEPPHVDHVFATKWCAQQEPPLDPVEVDSIVNKTVLAPFTNMSRAISLQPIW